MQDDRLLCGDYQLWLLAPGSARLSIDSGIAPPSAPLFGGAGAGAQPAATLPAMMEAGLHQKSRRTPRWGGRVGAARVAMGPRLS